MSNNQFSNAFDYKVVYVFGINDSAHAGYLKIGDASLHTDTPIDKLSPNSKELNQAALARIKSYTNTAGVKPVLYHTELAIRNDKKKGLVAFRDHNVHDVLKNSGMPNVTIDGSTGKEWFEVDVETAKKAINAVKQDYANLSNTAIDKHVPIVFRPEQEACIKMAVKHFQVADKFLMNAKMRYGKTLVTLEIVKQCGFRKTIILTHRPVVDDGWYEDFGKIFYGTDSIYGSKAKGYEVDELLSKGKPFIYFASIQDLRGSKKVGGLFDKNGLVFDTVWDCVIVDEAHEGTKTALGEDTVEAVVKPDQRKTKFLALSGTPFNILADFEDDSIFTWDYVMEQECKSEWDKNHFGDHNPYDELPQLKIFTYSLGDLLNNNTFIFEDKAFNFKEFFRTFTGDITEDHDPMPSDRTVGDFVHEDDIRSFLNLMVKDNGDSQYPYSTEDYRQIFRHTLWMVPGVKEAKALKRLMLSHPVFGNGSFDIVNVAGNEDEEEKYEEALSKVKTAIANSKKTGRYTITLSCGKLTTGVTVKEWTGVFMLSGSYSTSAANYLQTIFRVQSPCNDDGKIKETAFVFDFAPDRTLKMVSKAASINTGKGKGKFGDKKVLGKFLNYLPVISIEGSEMTAYSAAKLLQQVKNVYAERVVMSGFEDTALYNDEQLYTLTEGDLKAFKDLQDIIGKNKIDTKKTDIDVNKQGLTDEEYEEQEKLKKRKQKKKLTPEDEERLKELQEKKKLRNTAIDILRGISVRMPMLIYGAEIDYDNDITLDAFVDLVDEDSWNEFMPKGVSKDKFREFQKYYDEEVFIAAGRKIRYIARQADELDPEERVKKIASLFNCFKNPDKETVLTPWRVVNMHMSEAIGGWDFWDENHEMTIEKARFVDQGEITQQVFKDPDTKILEINSKTGLYPLYVAYSVYREKLNVMGDKVNRKVLWNQILRDNVFVICKTPMAKTITKRTLAGYSGAKINAHCFDDLINTLKNKPKQFIDKVLRPNFWGKEGKIMKFNAVVGNPPYQTMAQGTSNGSDPIYHLFIDVASQMCDLVSFIHPARFLFNAGKTPRDWNQRMLSDKHFKVIRFWSDSSVVFPAVDIKGGVAVTLWNGNKDYGAIRTFTPKKELSAIASKVKDSPCFVSICDQITNRGIYRFSELAYSENPDEMKKITDSRIGASAFDRLSVLFPNEKPDDGNEYVRFFGLSETKRTYRWLRRDYFKPVASFEKYKVFVPAANGSGALGEVLSTPVIGHPVIGHTETFLSVGCFDTEKEAIACYKYICSKFARTMLGVLKVTQHNSPEKWEYVPLQDFSENSDIDWSKPIADIDQQLYKKYGLTQEEIDFIEKNVVPME